MKKIVGILAAATVATSLFAADISAGTKIGATLFGFSADKTLSMLNENNDSHDYANPNLVLSVSDDKAGATVKLTTDGGNKTVAQTTQTIWFKPVDMLKVTVGNFDIALNKETIDWTESWTGLGGNGFLATVDVSGVTVDAGFSANGANWLEKADEADDPTIAQFFVKGSYAADFGTIGAFVQFNKITWNEEKGEGFYGYNPKDGAISTVNFGAGYKNTFDPITMFVNVIGELEDSFEWIRVEAFASGNVDAFGFAAFVAPLICTNSDVDFDPQVEVVAKVTYALDACTPYAYFKDADILADDFACTIKAGATGNCGLMAWDACLKLDVAKKVGVSVPVTFAVNF